MSEITFGELNAVVEDLQADLEDGRTNLQPEIMVIDSQDILAKVATLKKLCVELQAEVAALKERCSALQAENDYWVGHWQKNWKASLPPDLPKADGKNQPSGLGEADSSSNLVAINILSDWGRTSFAAPVLPPDLPKAHGMRVGPDGMSQPSDLGGTDE